MVVVTVKTTFVVLVIVVVVAGRKFVSVKVFCGAVTVATVTETPFFTVTVGVIVVVWSTVVLPVIVVVGATMTFVDLGAC